MKVADVLLGMRNQDEGGGKGAFPQDFEQGANLDRKNAPAEAGASLMGNARWPRLSDC